MTMENTIRLNVKDLPTIILRDEVTRVSVTLLEGIRIYKTSSPLDLHLVLVDEHGEVSPFDSWCSTTPTDLRLKKGQCEFDLAFNIISANWENRRLKLRLFAGKFMVETNVFNVYKRKLVVVQQPFTEFYNQDKKILDGNKTYCLTTKIQIQNAHGMVDTRAQTEVITELWYEDRIHEPNGRPAESTYLKKRKRTEPLHSVVGILDCAVLSDDQLTFKGGETIIRFRINEVSRNHGGKSFCLKVIPTNPEIAACHTHGIAVKSKDLSKRKKGALTGKKRRIKSESSPDRKRIKREDEDEAPTVTMTFKELRERGLSLARGNVNAMFEETQWIQSAVSVLKSLSRQPCGILSEAGESILVCRGCYIYFPESAKTRHTQDCMLQKLLKSYHYILDQQIKVEQNQINPSVLDDPTGMTGFPFGAALDKPALQEPPYLNKSF